MSAPSPSIGTQVLLAGLSNAAGAFVTNPIDVVKVRLQMEGQGVRTSTQTSVARALLQLASSEGLTGMYRGISASLCREMSYSGIRLGLYEPTKQMLGSTDTAHTPLTVKVLAGAITGCCGSALANPLDLVKVRMQGASRGTQRYASVFSALMEISREGGSLRGLWRGTMPTVQRATLLTASQVPAYDHVKHFIVDNGHAKEGYLCHFICSMIAGVVAAAVTSPVDLVKSRVMVQPINHVTGQGTLYTGTIDCFLQVVRNEGPLALYKGFNSQWLRIGPHTTVSLMVFEQLRYHTGLAYL